MRSARSFLAITAGLLVAVVAPAGVSGDTGTFTIDSPVLVSGPSPFTGCTAGATADGVNYPNTEVEPFVAINPANPANIVGAFQQDRWSDGGAKALTAARSTDGGLTWSRNASPFSTCSGGDSDLLRTTDPFVSFDSAGRAYQIALSVDSAALGLSAVLANSSTDGGATWTSPVTIQRDENPIEFNDKESITGDWRPTSGAGKAYATWIRGDLPGWDSISLVGQSNSFAYRGLPMFSKTTDGGATWSKPTSMTNSNIYVQGNQIAVLPDGTLVDVAAALFRGSGVQPSAQQAFWTALRSTNGGKTWAAPIKIARLGTALLTDPDNLSPTSLDETVRAGDYIPDVAVDHATGALYMVFADSIGDGWNHVKLTRSTDGGKTWSAPVDVTDTPDTTHSFNGTVEVTSDGTVAVMYYDFRNNDPSEPTTLETDVWLTHSHDGGATFSASQHVYGSFDMKNAPVARGWFLGDYQGMAAAGEDLVMFFAVSTSVEDSADVISIRAER